jgi:hypothetical protein
MPPESDLDDLRAELHAATKEWEAAAADLAAHMRSRSPDDLPSRVFHREITARAAVNRAARKLEECRPGSLSQ